MTNEPEVNAIPEVCPFLGLADDPESHATYATDVHRCYKMERPTRIAAPHQETFCISDTYDRCPVYKGDGIPQGTAKPAAASRPARSAPATPPTPVAVPTAAPERERASTRPQRPAAQGGAGSGPRRDPFATTPQRSLNPRRSPAGGGRGGGISMPVATIALFVLAIAVVAVAVFVLNQGDDDSPPLSDEAATRTAEAGGGDETPDDGGETATPDPDGEETPADGETPADNTPADGEPTEGAEGTPTEGGGGDGSTYTVVGGDSCSAIATAQGITLDELIAANPDLDPSSNPDCVLSVGQELTIP